MKKEFGDKLNMLKKAAEKNKVLKIPTCTRHLILTFMSKKCRKYALYAGCESII